MHHGLANVKTMHECTFILLGWSGISSFLFRKKSQIFDHNIDYLIQINTWSRVCVNLLAKHWYEFVWIGGSLFSSKICLNFFLNKNVKAYHMIGLSTRTSMVSIFLIKASDFTHYSPITLSGYYIKKACFGSVFRPEICRRFPYKVQQQILLSHRKVIGATF